MYSPERRRRVTLYFRDWLLILILVFMASLVGSKWGEYSSCRDPMAAWLVVNFLSLLALRLQQFAAQWCISGRSFDEEEVEDRSCVGSTLPKALLFCNSYILLPFIVAWTVLGCVWYNRSHECLPQSMSGWSFVAWIVLGLIMQLLQGGLMLAVAKRRAWHPRSLDVSPGGCHAWAIALGSLHLLMLDHLQRLEAQAMGVENDARAAAIAGRGGGGPPLNAVFLLRQPVVVVGPGQARPGGGVPTGLNAEQIAALEVRALEPVERREQLCSICLVEFPLLPPHMDPTAAAASAGQDEPPQPVWPPGSTMGADDDSGAASSSPVAASASDPALPRAPSPALAAAEVSTVRGGPPSRVYSSAPVLVFALGCRHVFHRECLGSWLKEEARCPNCRQRVGPALEELQALAQARVEAEQRAQIAAIQAQLQVMHDAHQLAAAAGAANAHAHAHAHANPPPHPPQPGRYNSPEALMRLSHYQQSQMLGSSGSSSAAAALAARSSPPPPLPAPPAAPGLPAPGAPIRFAIVNLHRDPSAAAASSSSSSSSGSGR